VENKKIGDGPFKRAKAFGCIYGLLSLILVPFCSWCSDPSLNIVQCIV